MTFIKCAQTVGRMHYRTLSELDLGPLIPLTEASLQVFYYYFFWPETQNSGSTPQCKALGEETCV